LPHDEAERRELFRSGAIQAGETAMTGARLNGKRVLVLGYGPTGAWAAQKAAETGAVLVDFTGTSNVAGANQADLDRLRAVDRVQETLGNAKVNLSMDRVLGIRPRAGGGAIVTFVKGEGASARTYSVEYDVILTAMKPDNSTVETLDPADDMPALMNVLSQNLKFRPLPPRSDGSTPMVLDSNESESDDGAIRVHGAAAHDGVKLAPNTRTQNHAGDLVRRRAQGRLSADSPDNRVIEAAGNAARDANKRSANTITFDEESE